MGGTVKKAQKQYKLWLEGSNQKDVITLNSKSKILPPTKIKPIDQFSAPKVFRTLFGVMVFLINQSSCFL